MVKNVNNVGAHPALKADFHRSSVMGAINDLRSLDPDALRRVEVIQKLFDGTKTLFMDWNDDEGNKKKFREFFPGCFSDPESIILQKIYDKTWSGLAYKEGATVVRSSQGFSPIVKGIVFTTSRHLTSVARCKQIPHTVGKALKSPSNNTLVTLVHELGHHAHFRAKEVEVPSNLKRISIYSKTNQLEHYAELFSAYVFAGPRMKKLFPAEYELVEFVLVRANLLK
jgi:hypothetical protein